MEPAVEDVESTVQALDTVLFRFATTEGDKFAAAVGRVLPKVLAMLNKRSDKVKASALPFLQSWVYARPFYSRHVGFTTRVHCVCDVYYYQVRTKVMEVLRHINARLKDNTHKPIMLPVGEVAPSPSHPTNSTQR